MPLIKICGISRHKDIEAANILLPDYVGFVFAQSRRQVSSEQAEALVKILNSRIKTVGVFVNENIKIISQIVDNSKLYAVQLHGDEDEDYIKALRLLLPSDCKVWKAVQIRNVADITVAKKIASDMLLFDAFSQNARGGTGESFDWELIKLTEVSRPFFLAGGITAENAAEAIRLAEPEGIDVSSSVETEGYKDFDKMKKLIRAVRNIKD